MTVEGWMNDLGFDSPFNIISAWLSSAVGNASDSRDRDSGMAIYFVSPADSRRAVVSYHRV